MTPNTKIFTDLLRESRAFLTVSAAEYGAGHNAAEAFRILPDSMLGILVRHCETVSCAGGLLHLYGGGQLFARNTKDNKPFSELFPRRPCRRSLFRRLLHRYCDCKARRDAEPSRAR